MIAASVETGRGGRGRGRRVQVTLDVTPWFEQADPNEVARLKEDGWGASEIAGDILPWMAENTKDHKAVFAYQFCRQNNAEWVVHVDPDAAEAWMHQQKIKSIAGRAVSNLMGEAEQTEFDPRVMAHELGQVAVSTPLLVAQRTWDAEARYGGGGNIWMTVLRALGYQAEDVDVKSAASVIHRLMYDVGPEFGEVDGEGELNYTTAEEVWPEVLRALGNLKMSPEQVKAIQWLWFNRVNET